MVSVVTQHPAGLVRVISVSTTNADTSATVDLRPAAGKRWIVIDAWAYHDDTGAARNINWQYYDGTTTIEGNSTNKANALRVPIHYISALCSGRRGIGPIVLSRDVYAQAKCSFATGETYKVYANALVLEVDE